VAYKSGLEIIWKQEAVKGVGRLVGSLVLVVLVVAAGGFVVLEPNTQSRSEAEDGFYQTQGGIVKCPGVEPGNTFDLDGKTYIAADNSNDDTLISNDKRICTTHVTAMSSYAWNGPRAYINSSYGNISSITTWDTSNVTTMQVMFYNADNFNQDISTWNTSRVTNMERMFYNADNFNQSIGSWNTSKVTNMAGMFYLADKFNRDISTWNTSNVENMRLMFHHATSFNRDISTWDTSNVYRMNGMFEEAISFNQDISSWCVRGISRKPDGLDVRAGFQAQTSLQPNWGTNTGCS
jgi:surface protein